MNPLSIFSPHFKNTNFCEFYKLIDITENSQQTFMLENNADNKMNTYYKELSDAVI